MTKLEEIARKLKAVQAEHLVETGSANTSPGREVFAHAAVQAMRDPSDAMIDAAAALGFCRVEDCREIWQAMIDAILNADPE